MEEKGSIKIHIDPDTEDEIFNVINPSFEETVEQVLGGMDEETIENISALDVARVFYANGFIHGATEIIVNRDFKENLSLMAEEISFQKKSFDERNRKQND